MIKEYFNKCPLINRGMSMGECYDVQMVAGNLIKPDILDFTLDIEKAKELCETCEFNQLKQKLEKTIKFGKPALNIDPEFEKKVLERLQEQKDIE